MSGSPALRTLGTYLWKEWRDYRSVLLGMVLVVPPLLALLGLVLPQKMFDHRGFAGYTAVACLAIFVISLTTDLVPGEARRGTLGFLGRLPAGLGPAFLAKLVLFAAGAALFTAYGYLAGADLCLLVAGIRPAAPPLGATTWILAVAALWTFALSCALPRGALSLPAAAALALLLGVPVLVCGQIEPSYGPQPWWRWESAALWGAGGVAAGWMAFRSRGLLRATRACVVVGAFCAIPYWADAAHYVLAPEASIVSGHVGEGGRYAFLDCARKGRSPVTSGRHLPPVIVDLRSGAAREAAPSATRFNPCSERQCPQRYVRLGPETFDGRSGEPARPTEEEMRDGLCATTPWRLHDGRRLWSAGGRLEADAGDGGVEILEERWSGGSPCGLGFALPRAFYDPTRRRLYNRKDLAIRRYQDIQIRSGRWLVQKRCRLGYELYDPESNALAPALGFERGEDAGAMLDDGRVFVTRGQAVLLLDPETGATTAVAAPAGVRVWDGGQPKRTPDGRRVLRLFCRNGTHLLARFDPATDTLAATAPVNAEGYAALLACPGDDEAIVHDQEALYRLRFGSDEREEIWRAAPGSQPCQRSPR